MSERIRMPRRGEAAERRRAEAAERRAEALRENLRKRKQQQASRLSGSAKPLQED